MNPPDDHPICTDLCFSSDTECSSAVAQCLDECHARIQGVSGLCALCLLDGAYGGVCGGGGACCPDPEFPASANACATVCDA